MASKQPIANVSASASANISECKKVARLNVASVNGQDYDIIGPERDAILADFVAMLQDTNALSEDTFAAKWANVKMDRSPSTD